MQKYLLGHDVMRHSFVSNFVAKFRSIGEAAQQAGDSESIIRKHYLDLKTTEEAEQFIGILPKQARASAGPQAAKREDYVRHVYKRPPKRRRRPRVGLRTVPQALRNNSVVPTNSRSRISALFSAYARPCHYRRMGRLDFQL